MPCLSWYKAVLIRWGHIGAAIIILGTLTVQCKSQDAQTDREADRTIRVKGDRGGRYQRDEQSTLGQSINTTTTLVTFNTTYGNTTGLTTAAPPDEDPGQGAGAIVGALFGTLLGCAIIGGALYLLIRYKRAQSAEYSRSVQLHMSSTRNAGVYVDLAEPTDPRLQGTDYTSLKQHANPRAAKGERLVQPDLYEYDSDDEVCVYK